MARGKVTRGAPPRGGNDTVSIETGTEGTIDLNSEAPVSGDMALVGDVSDGHIIVDGEQENENWDLPEGVKPPPRQTNGSIGQDQQETAQGEGFDEEDTRLAYGEEDDLGAPPRRGKRSKRNANRRAFVGAANEQIVTLQRQLEETQNMVRTLVTNQSGMAMSTLDSQIGTLESSLQVASEEMALAVKNSDGETFDKAQKIRDQIVGRLATLRAQKQAFEVDRRANGDGQDVPPQQRQPATQQVPPEIAAAVGSYFERFSERFPWFDPANHQDADSNIVRAVDRELTARGYQRHTPVFWQKMEERLARYNLYAEREGDEQEQEEAQDSPPQRQQSQGNHMGRPLQRPPTGNGRSTQHGRSGFQLSEIQTSLLRDEGLLGDSLSDQDKAKRDRIIGQWRKNGAALRGGGARQ